MKVIKYNDLIKLLVKEGDLKGQDFLEKSKKGTVHGSCCTCQTCGYFYDDCICYHNDLLKKINELVIELNED